MEPTDSQTPGAGNEQIGASWTPCKLQERARCSAEKAWTSRCRQGLDRCRCRRWMSDPSGGRRRADICMQEQRARSLPWSPPQHPRPAWTRPAPRLRQVEHQLLVCAASDLCQARHRRAVSGERGGLARSPRRMLAQVGHLAFARASSAFEGLISPSRVRTPISLHSGKAQSDQNMRAGWLGR